MAIVYQHRRKDTNTIFYIGIAKLRSRITSKSDRNPHWTRIVNKYGYEVDILIDGCTWEQACEIEKGLIETYGRADLGLGTLVNMTNGGEGICGYKHSDITRKKISDIQKGKHQPPASEKTKNKMSISKLGEKNPAKRLDVREKMKLAKLGVSSNRKGKINALDHNKKISETIKGKIKITNGIQNMYYEKYLDIPQGWYRGWSKKQLL